jgi:hypothetical protein
VRAIRAAAPACNALAAARATPLPRAAAAYAIRAHRAVDAAARPPL